jgi:D-methionine transport system ATP-binding protein
VLITHELDVIRAVADRVAVMDGGRIAETGTLYDVFAHPRTTAAADFVRGALRDRPSAETLARLRRRHPGRLVTIAVRDRSQTALARTFLAHNVAADIVFGGISELQERPVGSLTYELTGDDVDAALAALRADGVDVIEEDS